MEAHSGILAWEIPWTEEHGGLQSMGSQKSQTRLNDWSDLIYCFLGELIHFCLFTGLPCWLSGKDFDCQCRQHRLDPWVRKISWRRKGRLTAAFLPGKSHGQRSMAGCSPSGPKRVGHDLATKQQSFNYGIILRLLCLSQCSLFISEINSCDFIGIYFAFLDAFLL